MVLVAPHAGAWIEIPLVRINIYVIRVAPHAGAWIEISSGGRRRGRRRAVAPHAGAWIEILP